MFPKRLWNVLAVGACLSIFLYFFWSHGLPNLSELTEGVVPPATGDAAPKTPAPAPPPPEERPPGPIYKNLTDVKKRPPIKDNFPFADPLTMRGDMPKIASWNQPPIPHVPENTPLFIGFTRNWPMLQQCVLSYIASGWPPEDIYVVDNTGTMKSNFPPGKLSLQNPFYLNVQRLTDVFGVNVISTPTLLAFAQLQNFYIFTALEHGWDYFWWSHSTSALKPLKNFNMLHFAHLHYCIASTNSALQWTSSPSPKKNTKEPPSDPSTCARSISSEKPPPPTTSAIQTQVRNQTGEFNSSPTTG